MSELPERVGTIGAGNMAEAILHGLVRAGLAPTNLIASDPATARLEHLHTVLGIETTPDNAEVVRRAEVVVIAVKPQTLEAALAGLPRDPSPLFVSIVAGTPLAVLRTHLGPEARVVRTMPNTPALVGGGITAIAADPITPDQDIARAESVLASVGRVVRVPETQLDAVTGLSGSGPAYVFLLVEALTDAGVREGLAESVAQDLATETVLGAGRLLRESGDSASVLRERVSSPGGTTLAGLAALEEGDFTAIVAAAVRAATKRSRELGG
jgi:pyrroline-5-carboxylate reductase